MDAQKTRARDYKLELSAGLLAAAFFVSLILTPVAIPIATGLFLGAIATGVVVGLDHGAALGTRIAGWIVAGLAAVLVAGIWV